MKITTCQNCHKKPIEITYQQVINNQREDYYLCFSCAQKLGLGQYLPHFAKNLIQELLEKAIFENHNHGHPTTPQNKASESLTREPLKPKNIEIGVQESKILALTLDKEQALAEENYAEVARITKILEKLQNKR